MELEITGKLKKVKNGRVRFSFPACTISKSSGTYLCYLNSAARKVFDVTKGVNWYVETNYIIALPSKAVNAYKANSYGGSSFRGYTFPKELVDSRKVMPGTYKLYRYRDGFGFKHYERLEDQDEE